MDLGPDLKKTPLVQWHRDNGGKMVDFGGWEMPVQYQPGIIQEHLATRKFGGLFDVSHMGRFRFKGRDKIPFLQHVLSNNCQALDPWTSQYTIIANENGGALDDAFLYRFDEDDYLLVVNASNLEKDWAHFQDQARGYSDLVMEDHSQELAMIAFQGPLAKGILDELKEDGYLPDPRQNNLSKITLFGVELLISRTGYTGEPNSFELFVPKDDGTKVWDGIYQAGQDRGILPIGLGARDTLRLEASMPLYGHELGLDTEENEIPVFAIPLAVTAVSFSPLKGAFIGRHKLQEQFDALAAIRNGATEPPAALPRRIFSLGLIDRGIARQGHEVHQDGKSIGFVSSGTSTPFWELTGSGATMTVTDSSLLRSVALAYLDSTVEEDSLVEIAVRKRRMKAQVVDFHGRSDAPPYYHALPVGWTRPVRDPAVGEGLKKFREVTQRAVINHAWRQQECINLIPSEQTPSPLVRLLSVSDPVCRYAEHKELDAAFGQEVFYYQGTDFIAWAEDRLAAEMADFLGCDLVEVRPISGQTANMTIFSSLVSWKNRTNLKVEPARLSLAMTNHIGNGGHLSAQPMGALRDYIAKDPTTERFAVVNFPVLPDDPFRMDLTETAKLLDEYDPELLVFGKSMVIYKEPIAEVKELLAARGKSPKIMYDMAHVLGLIGPHFQEPFNEGADLVSGSTHKTFFGTQRGVIGCNFQEYTPEWELWEAIQRRSFPGMVSNHHLGSLLGLLAAAIEMNAFKATYQPQVITNAKALGKALADRGLNVYGDPALGYTETHQVIVGVGYGSGTEVAQRLEENNIITNFQAIPTDEGFTASSGLRLGTSEMTRFGMKEADMEAIAELMAQCIKDGTNVKDEVAKLRSGFTELQYCFSDTELESLKEELIGSF